jgi:hypothetical protein
MQISLPLCLFYLVARLKMRQSELDLRISKSILAATLRKLDGNLISCPAQPCEHTKHPSLSWQPLRRTLCSVPPPIHPPNSSPKIGGIRPRSAGCHHHLCYAN